MIRLIVYIYIYIYIFDAGLFALIYIKVTGAAIFPYVAAGVRPRSKYWPLICGQCPINWSTTGGTHPVNLRVV